VVSSEQCARRHGIGRVLASYGFAILFQVPGELLLHASLVGSIAHSVKTFLMRFIHFYTGGADFFAVALMAMAAEMMSKIFFPKQHIPGTVLYVPGLVLMMPGLLLLEGILQFMWIVQVSGLIHDPVILTGAFFDGFVNFFRGLLIIGGVGVGVAAVTIYFRPKAGSVFADEVTPWLTSF